MYYYPHHIGDFIADTARLTDSQCMAYLRLIWLYYDTESPLENSPESLAFKIGANPQDVALILKHYFVLDGDYWRQARCDKVISEYKGKSDKARKAAETKWKNARAMQTQCERNANACDNNADAKIFDANQKPITNNQEPIVKELVVTPSATPKKTGKRLPDDWKPDKQYWDAAQIINPDMTQEWFIKVAHKFKDYWIGKAGKDASKYDWLATWRNWIRREVENGKGGIGASGKKSYGEQREELFEGLTDYSKATSF